MHKHNGMRPQDVVILLKLMTYQDNLWTLKNVASSLMLSASEVTVAMERNRVAGLVDQTKRHVNKQALRDFIIYGLKYVFPPQVGFYTKGVPTANAAPPMNVHVFRGDDIYVWPGHKGTRRGSSVVPLYEKIPDFIESDPPLYEYLVLIDTFRLGKDWEIEIAIRELDKRFSRYNG